MPYKTLVNLAITVSCIYFIQVIMATNRADTLDPALLRPGRLDRKIEFPMPDRRQKRLIFSTVTSKMNLSDDIDLEDYVARPDKISGADINAICQEVIFLHYQVTQFKYIFNIYRDLFAVTQCSDILFHLLSVFTTDILISLFTQ